MVQTTFWPEDEESNSCPHLGCEDMDWGCTCDECDDEECCCEGCNCGEDEEE